MNQKITVKENTVREWVKKALNEFGTVPSPEAPPIKAAREPVVDVDERRPPLVMPPYKGNAEKRPAPRSTKSTRFEQGMSPEDLQKISNGLRADSVDIGGKEWTQEDIHIPERRGLGVSGVRKELETASDKIQLARETPELVIQMLEVAVKDYKAILREPMRVLVMGLREYTRDLEQTGELTIDEIKQLKESKGQAALATTVGFREFFDDWMMTTAPASAKRTQQRSDPLWFGSVFNVARAGTLDLDDKTPATKTLAEDFLFETSYGNPPTRVERMLILKDPGFRYYIGGLGGKHVYYWDAVRNAAESASRYKGQF